MPPSKVKTLTPASAEGVARSKEGDRRPFAGLPRRFTGDTVACFGVLEVTCAAVFLLSTTVFENFWGISTQTLHLNPLSRVFKGLSRTAT